MTTSSNPLEGTPRVLVVDDDPAIRTLIVEWLRRSGLECVEASDGEGALSLAQSLGHKLACAVVDVMMPIVDGFDVLARLRSQPETRALPVVLVSAHAKADADLVRGAELGADDHIAKPFSGRVLAAKVVALTKRRAREMDLYKDSEAPPRSIGGFAVGDRIVVKEPAFARDEHMIGTRGCVIGFVGVDGILVRFDSWSQSGPTEVLFASELTRE